MSHYLLFSNNKIIPNCSVIMNGQIVEHVSSTPFLGLCIYEKLSWKAHIAYFKGNISRCIGILCKACKVLKQSSLLTKY
jgi:hypothetical protein